MKKPAITELLKLLDKPALLNWANKQGLQGIDISVKRDFLKKEGTSMHEQIERYIRHEVPFDKPHNQLFFNQLFKNKEILFSEKSIETDYFTGRIDLKYIQNGKLFISDFKSNKKQVYFEDKLQLVAYSMAEQCTDFSIISIPDFTEIEVVIGDRKPYEEIIKSLSSIYKNKQLL